MKRISIEKVVKSDSSSFCAVNYENEYFTAPMHIHPEYELILIEKGTGHAFIGDMVYQMKPGDFMLIGSNLPHLWLSADEYYEEGTSLRSGSVYAQFNADVFPPQESKLEEFNPIYRLLEESRRGIAFTGTSLEAIKIEFRKLPSLPGFARIISLYQILHNLSYCPFIYLSGTTYDHPKDEEKDIIIQRTNHYISMNYQENISLEMIADYVGMNPSALCRYYKRRTGRKLFEYISELRISYATKLLRYRHRSIAQVAYDCGYNNASNFYRQFKRIVGKTPNQYCQHLLNIPEEQLF